MDTDILLTTELKNLTLFKRGKVRDVYDLGDTLLFVSTDRISCFDVILPTGIPDKGAILTQVSRFWFDYLKDICPNHFITTSVNEYPRKAQKYRSVLTGRSMLVRKTSVIPVECVVRGYLAGSGWKEYQKSRSICGISLPAGLQESQQLPEVIFTPSTKEDVGHDINVSKEYVEKKIGVQIAAELEKLSKQLYQTAQRYAFEQGILIADTKFEFGVLDKTIILVDEVLTPDSSRFWPRASYTVGVSQPSFDKQFVRDYLELLPWDKTPPGPQLPDEIVTKTSEKYREAYRRLTRKEFTADAAD